MKPVIGVIPLWDESKQSQWMLPGYLKGIEQAGGVPIVLPLTENPEEIRALGQLCGGFLFTGGPDVNPELYGEEPSPQLGELCPARDKMESILLWDALAQKKPILGICRGIQFLNAALGGDLYQDIPTQCPSPVVHHQDAPYDKPSHRVTLAENTPLNALMHTDTLEVNSCHHQAIRTLAPELTPMAFAPDGLVEAVYMPDYPFCWAVQWHPEFFGPQHPDSQKLFGAFVAAVRI